MHPSFGELGGLIPLKEDFRKFGFPQSEPFPFLFLFELGMHQLVSGKMILQHSILPEICDDLSDIKALVKKVIEAVWRVGECLKNMLEEGQQFDEDLRTIKMIKKAIKIASRRKINHTIFMDSPIYVINICGGKMEALKMEMLIQIIASTTLMWQGRKSHQIATKMRNLNGLLHYSTKGQSSGHGCLKGGGMLCTHFIWSKYIQISYQNLGLVVSYR